MIIGAGGIAIDTASYILHQHSEFDLDTKAYFKHWGIDPTQKSGLIPNFKPARTRLSLTLLQRSAGGMGRGLGRTTGWIHRLDLKRSGVRYFNSLSYESITPEGVSVVLKDGTKKLIPAQQVILCAGQESEIALKEVCEKNGIPFRVIGEPNLRPKSMRNARSAKPGSLRAPRHP